MTAYALPAFPISQENIALFITFLGRQGLSVSTIESYLAGLRHYNLCSDPSNMFPSVYSPYIKLLLRGVRRAHLQKQPTLVRLPITGTVMARLRASLARDPSNYQNILTWAACCTGFFSFLRAGEFVTPDVGPFNPSVHLSVGDVAFNQEEGHRCLHIQIKASKTDQFRSGCTVVLGATQADICPVAALLDYLNRRGSAPGPLFINPDQTPLRCRQFVTRVQEALTVAGLPGANFNGHSFRIGVATTASHAGIPETTIKNLGKVAEHGLPALHSPRTSRASKDIQTANLLTGYQGCRVVTSPPCPRALPLLAAGWGCCGSFSVIFLSHGVISVIGGGGRFTILFYCSSSYYWWCNGNYPSCAHGMGDLRVLRTA